MKPRLSILALALLLSGACAHRDAIISRTLGGLRAAHESFVEIEERHEAAIVARSTTKEQAIADVAASRAVGDKIQAAFLAAFAAAAAASLDPTDLNMSRMMTLGIAAVAALKGWTP